MAGGETKVFSTCLGRDITVVDIENKYGRKIYFVSLSTIY